MKKPRRTKCLARGHAALERRTSPPGLFCGWGAARVQGTGYEVPTGHHRASQCSHIAPTHERPVRVTARAGALVCAQGASIRQTLFGFDVQTPLSDEFGKSEPLHGSSYVVLVGQVAEI